MDKLNELVELANKANLSGYGSPEMVDFRVTANPDAILTIGEAFRELEKRAEAAEAQIAELERQEPAAFRLDPKEGPSYLSFRCGEDLKESGFYFADCVPLFTRHAPAADMAEVTQKLSAAEILIKRMSAQQSDIYENGKKAGAEECLAKILRLIEGLK